MTVNHYGIGDQSAHLLADSVEELHFFAKSIGLKKEWLQTSNSSVIHYDISKFFREKAIWRGANTCPKDFRSALKRAKNKLGSETDTINSQ